MSLWRGWPKRATNVAVRAFAIANYPWFGPSFVKLARHTEAMGFESMWIGEHIIIRELREYCEAEGRDLGKRGITLLLSAAYMNIGERPPRALENSLGDASELIPRYQEAGVGRLIVGLDDMTDEKSFTRPEEAARALDLL